MAGFTYLMTQKDPSLRPTKAGALAFIAGVLLTSGGFFQAYLGVQNTPVVLGMHGPPLTALGIVGLLAGFIVAGLAAYISFGETLSRLNLAGYLMIVISTAGFFTSFLGFFLAGMILGIVAGVLTVRTAGRRNAVAAREKGPVTSATEPTEFRT